MKTKGVLKMLERRSQQPLRPVPLGAEGASPLPVQPQHHRHLETRCSLGLGRASLWGARHFSEWPSPRHRSTGMAVTEASSPEAWPRSPLKARHTCQDPLLLTALLRTSTAFCPHTPPEHQTSEPWPTWSLLSQLLRSSSRTFSFPGEPFSLFPSPPSP